MGGMLNCDHLIDAIYDAGASPEQWPSVLSSIAAAAGAQGGVVFGFSKSQGLIFEYNGALDPECSAIFKVRHANNAWVQGMAGQSKNQLVVSDSLISRRRLMRSAFYDEVLKPQKLAHAALAMLTAGSDIEIQFSVQKSVRSGPFSARELTTLRRLVPHVRRALGVSLRLKPGASPANSAADGTGFLSCAAVTLNRRGELVEANVHAQRLAANGVLRLSKEGLMWSDPSELARFYMAIKSVEDGVPLRCLELTEGTHRVETVCAALDGREAQSNEGRPARPATVLVLLRPAPRQSCDPSESYLNGAKGLTGAEWRVTKAAASGLSNAELAGILGISLNTLKTHLRRIYYKLDVNRQSELIVLLNRARVAFESPD